MDLPAVVFKAIDPALGLLPPDMDSPRARVMMLAIGLQESRFEHRRQIGGPARGFWQFEQGTQASRGGVWGVYLHEVSRPHMRTLCVSRGVLFDPYAVYVAIEQDDVLAAGMARLLLWTDPRPLPNVDDTDSSWALYLRTWRPGKPHPSTWPAFHRRASEQVAQ